MYLNHASTTVKQIQVIKKLHNLYNIHEHYFFFKSLKAHFK
uniref:Uncharacterized protein n=1 Tax=Anguilla anguilla TaxID=7936 RepID=A0A0E9XQL9_ANGAN